MLTYFKLDTFGKSLDWGTLLIYTCKKSCLSYSIGYKEEFLWKQDILNSNEEIY